MLWRTCGKYNHFNSNSVSAYFMIEIIILSTDINPFNCSIGQHLFGKPDCLVKLCRVPRHLGALWQLQEETTALVSELVLKSFLERILTPRSSIRYIGLENPSACLFTAADSLLSVTNSDLMAPIFYIHRRGFSLTWLLVSLAFPSLFDTTGFLSKVENNRAAPSLNSSFMLEFHLWALLSFQFFSFSNSLQFPIATRSGLRVPASITNVF